MRHWQATSCLLLILVCSCNASSTLDDTCKSVSAGNDKDIGYDYCIKFFQANNGSATAEDKRGLTVIATKIIRAEAVSTRKRVDAIKSKPTDKNVSGRLSDCRVIYTRTLDWLDAAAKSIKSGNLQDAVAQQTLREMILSTDTCEEGFRWLGVPSPLAAEDAEFTKDCYLALAITSTL